MILDPTRLIGVDGVHDIDQSQYINAYRGFFLHFAPRRLEYGLTQFLGAAG